MSSHIRPLTKYDILIAMSSRLWEWKWVDSASKSQQTKVVAQASQAYSFVVLLYLFNMKPIVLSRNSKFLESMVS